MGLTFSLIWTSAANALLLLHLNPLWCAVLGRVFLGDKLPRRTILALAAALCCMMLIFVPDIVDRSNSDGDADAEQAGDEEDLPSSSTSTKGNVTAFFTGIMLAVYIAIVRKAGMENNNNTDQESNNNNNNTAREKESDSKEINLVGATSLSALLVSMIVLITRHGNVLPDSSWRGGGGVGEQGSEEGGTGVLWQFWLAMVADGMALGIIVVCLAIAPRLANGAEVALVLLLEVILGPLWVFLAYRDVPSMWTMIGGFMYAYRSVPCTYNCNLNILSLDMSHAH
jgi:drug/metabolite transporter (DMT)-like permease